MPVVMLALLVCPHEGPGRPQEAVQPPDPLVSWYAVFKGDAQVGYLHESLDWAAPPDRYAYLLEAEFEISSEDGDLYRSLRLEARLDRAFRPRTGEGLLGIDRERTRLSISGGRIRWKDHAAGLDDRPAFVPLLLYRMRHAGRLARPGLHRTRMFDPREPEAPFVDVTLDVGRTTGRDCMGRTATLTRVRFVSPPPSTCPEDELVEAWVDRYGRIAEAFTRGGLRAVLVRTRHEAMEPLRFLTRGWRRDPFAKEPAMRANREVQETSLPLVPAENLPSMLRMSRKDLDVLAGHVRARRLEDARRMSDRLLAAIGQMRASATAERNPALLAEVDEFRDALEEVWPIAARARDEANRDWIEVLESERRDDCTRMAAALERLKRHARSPALAHRPEAEDVAGWIRDAGSRLERCRIRADLAAKPLHVSATAIREEPRTARFDPSVGIVRLDDPVRVRYTETVAEAVINGETYRVGDVVEGQDVVVERIRAHGIRVSYRGEIREVPLGRK